MGLRQVCSMYVATAALALLTSAGCQSTGPQHTARAAPPPTEATPPLTNAQRADLKFALGRSLESGGDLDRAIAVYTDILASEPKRVDVRLRLAALYERQGRLNESHECYLKALALAPANADVCCNVGYSLYLEQDWPQAAKYLRYALQLKPDHARAHNNLGLVLARLGRPDEAYTEFKKAGCSNAEAHANLAYCYMIDGNAVEARHDYQTALELDPRCAPAKSGLQDLRVVVAHFQTSQPGNVTPVSASTEGTSSSNAVDWHALKQPANDAGQSQ